MSTKHLVFGGAAVLILLATLALVYTKTITFEEAISGSPLLIMMVLGVYQWREKATIKKKYLYEKESREDLEVRLETLRLTLAKVMSEETKD